ncbi:hypothetical protein BSL78_22850 [Apostichopus japonicus]|uniref:Mutator-like transposase domain-containing protein n=1 Tax=Stichopus japonicus TaxID=307972 RepID=A0A2G8JX41_STIJA|nr:hypothetical protein BSL78_22850 [Apostichopus japonicus]
MGRRKGMYRRRATTFKPGHRFGFTACTADETDANCTGNMPSPSNTDVATISSCKPAYKRLSKEEYERVVNSPVKGPEIFSSQSQQTMLLRPTKHHVGQLITWLSSVAESTGNRVVNLQVKVRAYHSAMMAHREASNGCAGLLISVSDMEEFVGLGSKVVFGCTLCNYRSELLPLYKVLNQSNKPGRNPSELNIALQLGLHQTSISSTAARRLLSSISLPSPAVSTLQKSANQFGPVMKEINENDMAEKRGIIKETLQLRGLSRDSPIFAEYDRQYNNPLRNSRSKTPFAPASQCRDVIVENVTMDKFVIGYHHSNKLCLMGEMKRRRGHKVQCPGHKGCSANLRQDANIGDEQNGGKICASNY